MRVIRVAEIETDAGTMAMSTTRRNPGWSAGGTRPATALYTVPSQRGAPMKNRNHRNHLHPAYVYNGAPCSIRRASRHQDIAPSPKPPNVPTMRPAATVTATRGG